MDRRLARILVVLVLSLGLATSASAITYIYTSIPGDTSPYAGIDYSITLNEQGSTNVWDCTFSIATPSSVPAASPYYVGWFQIKFDGGVTPLTSSTASMASSPTGPSGDWNGMSNTNVLGWGNEPFPQNTWSGYYTNTATIGNYTSVMPNLYLADHTYSWDFDVSMLGLSDPFTVETTLPFQVGFYGGLIAGGTRIQTARLSETAVPEPNTLMLILLIGPVSAVIAGIRRKKKMW
jgi:hypothetical protein